MNTKDKILYGIIGILVVYAIYTLDIVTVTKVDNNVIFTYNGFGEKLEL